MQTVVERVLPEVDNVQGNSKVVKPLENKCKQKLGNSSLHKIENSPSELQKTRSTRVKLGVCKQNKIHQASGYGRVFLSG